MTTRDRAVDSQIIGAADRHPLVVGERAAESTFVLERVPFDLGLCPADLNRARDRRSRQTWHIVKDVSADDAEHVECATQTGLCNTRMNIELERVLEAVHCACRPLQGKPA